MITAPGYCTLRIVLHGAIRTIWGVSFLICPILLERVRWGICGAPAQANAGNVQSGLQLFHAEHASALKVGGVPVNPATQTLWAQVRSKADIMEIELSIHIMSLSACHYVRQFIVL